MSDGINDAVKQPDGSLAEMIREPGRSLWDPFHKRHFGGHFSGCAGEANSVAVHQGKAGCINWIDSKPSSVFYL